MYTFTLQSFAPVWANGRVSRVTREDSQEWRYGYDARQQVIQGYHKFTTGAGEVLAGTESEYTYDKIGNRIVWKEGGGTSAGTGLRTNTYGGGSAGDSADSLNRYTSATRPQFYDVTGQRATGTTAILVNDTTFTYQQGSSGLYFGKEETSNASGRFTYTTVKVNNAVTDAWNQFTATSLQPSQAKPAVTISPMARS